MSPLATALCSVLFTLAPQATDDSARDGSNTRPAAVVEGQSEIIEEIVWLDRTVPALEVDAVVRRITRNADWPDRFGAFLVARSGDGGSNDGPSQYGILLRGSRDAIAAMAERARSLRDEDAMYRQIDAVRLDAATVSVDFPGGTVEEFVAAALGKFGFVPPVYGDDAIRSLRVRPVKTHRMSISAALELLTRVPPTDASGEPVRLRITGAGETIVGGASPVVAAERTVDLQRSRVIVIERDPEALELSQPVRRAAIFLPPTRSSDAAIEELLDAISVAVHLEKRSPTFVAKMHRPSRMLIVRGTEDELGVVAQVVRGFEPNVRIELPTFSAADAPTRPTSDAPAGR